MKRLKLTFCLLFVLGTTMASNVGGQIPMSVSYEKYGDLSKPHPRSPIAPIYTIQEGHNFSFNSSLADETIEVFDGDTLLYTTIIESDGTVSIPENITGEVELCLVRGNLTYRAVVEL